MGAIQSPSFTVRKQLEISLNVLVPLSMGTYDLKAQIQPDSFPLIEEQIIRKIHQLLDEFDRICIMNLCF